MVRFAVFLVLIFSSLAVYAVPAVTTYIDHLRVAKNGMATLYLRAPLVNQYCATHSIIYFDSTTAGGKSMLSVALAAKTSNKQVYMESVSDCMLDLIQLDVN